MFWSTKKLGEVAKSLGGGTPSRSNPAYFKGNIPWITVTDLTDDLRVSRITDARQHITSEAIENSSTNLIPAGAVILTTRVAVGKVGIALRPIATNQDCTSFITHKDILPEFLAILLLANRDVIKGSSRGIGIMGVRRKDLEELQIPLPPIEEQKRIVENIEKLFAKIDEASQLRAGSSTASNALLPSVLHNIFDQAEKKGWEVKAVGEICEKPQYGYTASANREKVGPKLLRITDIQNGQVDWEQVPYCKCEDALKYQLCSGDIVFARTGATVGKSFLIETVPKRVVFASYLIRLRAKAMVVPKYLYVFFQSPDYWQQIAGHQVGAAQPNVNASKLSEIEIPLPPIAEQQQIVAYLDSLSAKSRTLQELQKQTATDLAALKQSILAKAFSGELA